MTKTKSCVATRDAVCQATNLFPDEVGTKKCLLPYLFGYLFSVAYDNRYLVRGSKENVPSIGNTPGNHIVSGFGLMALPRGRTQFNNLSKIWTPRKLFLLQPHLPQRYNTLKVRVRMRGGKSTDDTATTSKKIVCR